jgi:preprotein translocase subunit SecF
VEVKVALSDAVDYRRIDVVGPRVSGEFLHWGIIGIMVAIGAIAVTCSSGSNGSSLSAP